MTNFRKMKDIAAITAFLDYLQNSNKRSILIFKSVRSEVTGKLWKKKKMKFINEILISIYKYDHVRNQT